MKRFLTILCFLLLSVFCTPGFCADKLTDSGYRSITTHPAKYRNPSDIVSQFAKMETDLNTFISKENDKSKTSKLFGIYIKDLYILIDNFFEVANFNMNGNFQKLDISQGEHQYFTNPRVNNIYIDNSAGMIIVFDYDHILKNYGPYLSEDWNIYIKYKIEEWNDLTYILFDEDVDPDSIKRKWADKWAEFVKLYPEFPLSDQLNAKSKEIINADGLSFYKDWGYTEDSQCSVSDIGIYKFLILMICILGVVIIFIRKFALIGKSKEFAQNQVVKLKLIISNIFKSFLCLVRGCKKVFFIALGVVIVAFTGSKLYNANSLPKCDSELAEEMVIQIYKENNKEYKNNIENVDRIVMENFIPQSYDKELGKYTCTAQLTVYAKPDKSLHYAFPFKKFRYTVKYELYKARGKNAASASWELHNLWETNKED